MNNKALTLSLVMAVVAVFFVNSYVTTEEEKNKQKFGTEIRVVIASKDIREMDTLDETMLEFKLVPKAFLEPAAITMEKKDIEGEVSRNELIKFAGSVAVVPIKKGEQLTFSKISEPGLRTGLSPQVAPGKRALSIGVSEVSGVGKLIKPGDRVDIIAVIEGEKRLDKTVKTILQDVGVLAVGRFVTNNLARTIEMDGKKERVRNLNTSDTYSVVTIEVDPTQAEYIVLLQAINTNGIILTLRNNDDTDRLNNIPQIGVQDLQVMDSNGLRRLPASSAPPYPINRGGTR